MRLQSARHKLAAGPDGLEAAGKPADASATYLDAGALMADSVLLELDAVQELERRDMGGGRGGGWALRFPDADVERRFQLFHEQTHLTSARWGSLMSLLSLVVLLAGCWTRRRLKTDQFQTCWPLVYAALSVTLALLAAWSVLTVRWRRRGDLDGKLQRVLAVLGVSVVLLVLATPGFSSRGTSDQDDTTATGDGAGTSSSSASSRTDGNDSSTLRLLLAERGQDVTLLELSELTFFELVALLAVATSWGAQFPTFCSCAAVATVGSACWWATSASSLALGREWHVLALFLGALILLSVAIYHRERESRGQFLRLRRLLLENVKLGRQNGFLQQQLSSHVDAVGFVRRSLGGASTPTSTSSSRASSWSSPKAATARPGAPPAALGESWMENVLKTLVMLKRALGEQRAGDAVRQLEFVIEALTGEHDLFLANSGGGGFGLRSPASLNRRRSVGSSSTPQLDSIDAGGWLSLLNADPRQRRRLSSDKTSTSPKGGGLQRQSTFPPAAAGISLRRTDSGFLQSVLFQVDGYFNADAAVGGESPRRLSLSSLPSEWSAAALLRRAASSDELDLFALAQACELPLSALLLTTVESHNLFLLLPLRVESAAAFAREIERRYQPKNPYHNALHAASVVWDVNFFLRRLERPALSALQMLSALVAAAVHDVNHPGVNNAYLVATSSPLAIKYSDDSVLERMHLAECFQACAKDGCDVFEAFPRDQKRQSRQLIIAMVLATDLSGHVQHVNRLKSKCYALQATGDQAAVPVDLALTSVIMMADLGHAFKSFEAHRAWSLRVTDEFFAQGDAERQFHLPVSPLCDRQRAAGKFEASQIGFLEFVVLPLYLAVRDVVPPREFDRVLAQIRRNADEWRQPASLQGAGAEATSAGGGTAAAATTELREAASV